MSKKETFLSLYFLSALFLCASFYYVIRFASSHALFFFGVVLFNALLIYVFFVRKRFTLESLVLECQKIEEEQNLAEKNIARSLSVKASLEKKILNYQELESYSEQLNNEITLDRVCDIVTSDTARLFGGAVNVLLYLVHEKSRHPELRSARTQEPDTRIREKTGDLFDHWVLRHGQPLLVEAAMSDFRFDPEKTRQERTRPVGSLIEVPLHAGTAFLGLLRVEAAPVGAFSGDDLRFLSVIAHIAELAIENATYVAHAQELSITDGLTGIYLRRYGLERLREEFLRATSAGAPMSFLMLDIDHFKDFNDTFGHVSGDLILTKISQWLKNFFQVPGHLVFRYGGEEFGVVLPFVLKKEAVRLAESFRLFCAEQVVTLRRQRVAVTVSVGVANIPKDAGSPEDLIRLADEALLRAKKEGRNRVCSC